MGLFSTSCVAQMAAITPEQHVTNWSDESPNTIRDISEDSRPPDGLSYSCFRNGSRESPTRSLLNDKSKADHAQKRKRSCAVTSTRFRVFRGGGDLILRDPRLRRAPQVKVRRDPQT